MKKYLLYIIPLILNIPLSMILTSCHDDPEPIVEPDDPNKYRPISWFDQEHKDRWPIKWKLSDSDKVYGSGEYEIPISKDGDNIHIRYLDQEHPTQWFEFDGIFLRIFGGYISNLMYGFSFEYEMEGESVHINFDPNPTTEERKIIYCAANNNTGMVKFIFKQQPGNINTGKSSESLIWKSESHTFVGAINQSYKTICNSDGETFKIKCLNRDNLKISSITVNGNIIDIVDNKNVSSDNLTVSVVNNMLTFNIPPSSIDRTSYYVIKVVSGDLVSTFNIQQPSDSNISTEFCERRTPEWIVERDGIALQRDEAYKVSSMNDKLTATITNFNSWQIVELWIDGSKEEISYDNEDIKNFLNLKQEGSKLEINFSSNFSIYERVVEMRIKCKNNFLNTLYSEYSTLTFVQAPRDREW